MKSLLSFLKYVSLGTSLIAARAIAATPPPPPNSIDRGASSARDASSQPSDLFGGTGIFHTIANVLIFVIGAVAVIMLIIGGLRYVISQGDAAATKQAKDTILYAIVGIVVAVMAYAIVSFISKSLT